MTKQVAYYRRLFLLKESLKDFAEQPTDGADVEGAELRLHATHVVRSMEKRIENLRLGMSSAEMAEIIQG